MKTYEIFTGDELVIAEKIQQRRYQMLIHSCIYYKLNYNLVSDRQWDIWAKELKELQLQYPDISKQVTLYEYFDDWDGSTGAFLPLDLDWVIRKAEQLSGHQLIKKVKKVDKRRLF